MRIFQLKNLCNEKIARCHLKHLLYPIALINLFMANSASAHVKWFVTSEGEYAHSHFHLDFISLLLFLGFALFMCTCILINLSSHRILLINKLLYYPFINPTRSGSLIWTSLKVAIAILLIANIVQGNFIAPNFEPTAPTSSEMILQALLLIILIFNVDFFAFALLLTSLILFIAFPIQSAIDYAIELLAVSLALYFTHKNRLNRPMHLSVGNFEVHGTGVNIGLSILRIGLGLQLIILTIHDKFMHPGLALQFLNMHENFNFMRLIGISSFTHLHFVLAAGLAELSFGLLLITNISTRIGLGLILFFFTLTGFVLGLEELMGHVPILIAALILFAFPTNEFIKISDIRNHGLAHR